MFHCMDVPQSIYPFTYKELLGCFQMLAIMNKAAINKKQTNKQKTDHSFSLLRIWILWTVIKHLLCPRHVSFIFSILFPRFWIIYAIITVNSFSGRLPVSSPFVWSGAFLPSSFICCVFLCLLILLNLLCLASPFRRLQVHSSRCFWCLPPVGKVVSVGCVGFLVEGTGACVLVDAAGSCLSGGQGCVWCLF